MSCAAACTGQRGAALGSSGTLSLGSPGHAPAGVQGRAGARRTSGVERHVAREFCCNPPEKRRIVSSEPSTDNSTRAPEAERIRIRGRIISKKGYIKSNIIIRSQNAEFSVLRGREKGQGSGAWRVHIAQRVSLLFSCKSCHDVGVVSHRRSGSAWAGVSERAREPILPRKERESGHQTATNQHRKTRRALRLLCLLLDEVFSHAATTAPTDTAYAIAAHTRPPTDTMGVKANHTGQRLRPLKRNCSVAADESGRVSTPSVSKRRPCSNRLWEHQPPSRSDHADDMPSPTTVSACSARESSQELPVSHVVVAATSSTPDSATATPTKHVRAAPRATSRTSSGWLRRRGSGLRR